MTVDQEMLNVGDAMDAESGSFIATIAGIDFFSISRISSPNSGSLSFSFMKNRVAVAAALGRRS